MSAKSERPQTNNRNSRMRMAPSTRLNAKLLFKAVHWLFRPVAAARGTNLYMKMKKASEKTMLAIMARLPISAGLASDFGSAPLPPLLMVSAGGFGFLFLGSASGVAPRPTLQE